MGMLLQRHKTINKEIKPENDTKDTFDYRELDYNSLKSYAKEQGVDINKYRKKEEILAILDGKEI